MTNRATNQVGQGTKQSDRLDSVRGRLLGFSCGMPAKNLGTHQCIESCFPLLAYPLDPCIFQSWLASNSASRGMVESISTHHIV